mmetsp:Transcript_26212/g.46623  ORF Transcript_26212/g.46623 Transcript_26212/m.46623 type:complete len:91 (-) Transcript_26212:43-315(-)
MGWYTSSAAGVAANDDEHLPSADTRDPYERESGVVAARLSPSLLLTFFPPVLRLSVAGGCCDDDVLQQCLMSLHRRPPKIVSKGSHWHTF